MPVDVYLGGVIEFGSKARKLPAPPPIVWESLATPHMPGARPWLHLLPDEIEPTILASEKPVSVLWSSLWPSRPNDQVHLSLTGAGNETLVRFILRTPDDPPDASKTGHLRRRVNHLLFSDLRYSYGQ
jgi:hypothetical protein